MGLNISTGATTKAPSKHDAQNFMREPQEGLRYTIELILPRVYGSNRSPFHFGTNPYLKIFKTQHGVMKDLIKVTRVVNNTIYPTFHGVFDDEFDFTKPQTYRVEVHHAEEYKSTPDRDHI